MPNTSNPLGTLLPIIIVFAIVLLRMRRMSGVRPMSLPMLWVRPAIIAVFAIPLVYTVPPHGLVQVLILVATVGAGAVLGWHQGKMMAISVDASTGTLQVQASMWAIALFIGIILLRAGLRTWLTAGSSPLHAYVGVVTDGLVLFVVGLYGARAVEMFLRGRALLAASRAQSGQPG